ncbi:hypothetical protein A7K91_24985 [Paenibacillus oryzae]|uniref:Uncharacterized protein n=1 Tax=Paenibacillus oryzae TaxID=1844972 RepID=A0A1A5YC88_9BACL|nr:YxlC family protein [Paenibacillus oryzae]OBR63213.1 hypothetical protein A7K91_24985 [Paenibacillus oryzae]
MNNGYDLDKSRSQSVGEQSEKSRKSDKSDKSDKSEKGDTDAIWFQENMMQKLKQFDAAHTPEPPALGKLEIMVADHKRKRQKAMWTELTLFWLVAVIILLGMVWMAEASPGLFWGFYGTVGAVFLLIFGYKYVGWAKD